VGDNTEVLEVLDGLYSAATGMLAQQRRLDAIANDVANVNTHGYKRVRVAFRDLVYQPAGQGAAQGVAPGSGAAAEIAGRSSAPGSPQPTGRPLDVAIDGPGYLRLDGDALTRDGAFQIDADGQLTVGGRRLAPPIGVPRGTRPEDVTIAPDGRVAVGERQLGRIELIEVPAPDGLTALGDGLYAATANSGTPRAAGDARLVQGALEGSNVDLADAMVDMMDAQRGFALASRAVQMQDQALEIANGLRR
jgi:flagellar basal-body rod protein FlgG